MIRRRFQIVTAAATGVVTAAAAGTVAGVAGIAGAAAGFAAGLAVVAAIGPWSTIDCNVPTCGRTFDSFGPVRWTRQYAAARGWTSPNRRTDLCPAHSAGRA